VSDKPFATATLFGFLLATVAIFVGTANDWSFAEKFLAAIAAAAVGAYVGGVVWPRRD
jgi:hypothetical protein